MLIAVTSVHHGTSFRVFSAPFFDCRAGPVTCHAKDVVSAPAILNPRHAFAYASLFAEKKMI